MLLTDSKLDLFLILKDKFQHKLNLIKVKASIYNMSSLFFLQTKCIDSLLAGFSPRHLQGSELARILLILRQLTGGGASLPDTARSRQRVSSVLFSWDSAPLQLPHQWQWSQTQARSPLTPASPTLAPLVTCPQPHMDSRAGSRQLNMRRIIFSNSIQRQYYNIMLLFRHNKR